MPTEETAAEEAEEYTVFVSPALLGAAVPPLEDRRLAINDQRYGMNIAISII